MTPPEQDTARGGRALRAAIWLPGLAVAVGAAAATAHGLYEVAAAARVPAGLAWLYPLITDGLALVAYAATARLHGRAARYAWTVVVAAAGLSGLAQATYLAGGALNAAPVLRFGVGAWPAVAAAVVAHLLYLLATDPAPSADPAAPGAVLADAVQAEGVQSVPVQPAGSVQPALFSAPDDCDRPPLVAPTASSGEQRPTPAGGSPARDRAEAAATRHAHRHAAWPTVTELEAAAEVSRGTAAAALKELRTQPIPLH